VGVVMPHKCSCCGSTKHRLETCKHPAAAKIRALQAKVRVLQGSSQKAKPNFKKKLRVNPQSSGDFKAQASLKYTGKKPRSKYLDASQQRRLLKCTFDDSWASSDEKATDFLLKHKVLKGSCCPRCKKADLKLVHVIEVLLDWRETQHFATHPTVSGGRYPAPLVHPSSSPRGIAPAHVVFPSRLA
jgi:hypothetical protein